MDSPRESEASLLERRHHTAAGVAAGHDRRVSRRGRRPARRVRHSSSTSSSKSTSAGTPVRGGTFNMGSSPVALPKR